MADEGQSGASKIARLEKGNKDRTARHAAVMNEIIDAVNALRSAKVTFQNDLESNQPPTGKFLQSDSNSVLELHIGKGGVDVAIGDTGDFAEGETEVDDVKKITFNQDLFKIHDNGGGEVQVSLKTTTCS